MVQSQSQTPGIVVMGGSGRMGRMLIDVVQASPIVALWG